MMTVEQAIEVVDEFVRNKGADLHTQAWDDIRSHIERRVVTGEMNMAACEAYYQHSGQLPPTRAMRAALQAALGGE